MTQKLMTFKLNGQLLGLNVQSIREIRSWTPVTRIPNSESYVLGVANLRGTILPIIDLAKRFGWGSWRQGPQSAIIVFENSELAQGFVVDEMRDIIEICPDEIITVGCAQGESFEESVLGLMECNGEMVTILRAESLHVQMSQRAAA